MQLEHFNDLLVEFLNKREYVTFKSIEHVEFIIKSGEQCWDVYTDQNLVHPSYGRELVTLSEMLVFLANR